MFKVLVLGASGLVGKALIKELDKKYDVYGTYYSKNLDISSDKAFKLDVSNFNSIKKILETIQPKLVISCLRGDFDKQLKGHKEAAEYLNKTGGKLYFCSTANVFDNDTTKPHYEYDNTDAESDYGKFKIKCEEELKEILGDNLITLRLPMIWGKDSPRLNELLSKIKANKEVEVYSNLYLNNNTDVMLAKQIHYIMENNLRGVFHLATNDIMTQYKFTSKLIKRLGYENVKIKEITLPSEKYYFAIALKRKELPDELKISNEDIINYLSK